MFYYLKHVMKKISTIDENYSYLILFYNNLKLQKTIFNPKYRYTLYIVINIQRLFEHFLGRYRIARIE